MRVPINVNGQPVVIDAADRLAFVRSIVNSVTVGTYAGSDLERMSIAELREYAGEEWDRAIAEAQQAAQVHAGPTPDGGIQAHAQVGDAEVSVRVDPRMSGARKASTGA